MALNSFIKRFKQIVVTIHGHFRQLQQ